MRKYYPLLFLLFTLSASAQKKLTLRHYDMNWKPVKLKDAYYHVEQVQINDTCWEWNYYTAGQPRWQSLQFKDEKGKVLHGDYIIYNSKGLPDTTGQYYNGKPDGEWYVMASNARVLKRIDYKNGVIVAEKDSATLTREREKDARERADSDSARGFRRVEVESEFTGGLAAWRAYLMTNFRYPEESIKRQVEGTVVVQFIVDKNGKVEFPGIYKSVEYFLDRESLRLIIQSPDWKPAEQSGTKVKSYKRQPVVFRFE